MLVVFFGLWVAPASILGGPGQVLEPSKPNSSRIFGVRKHAPQKCSSCNKIIVFAMFYRLRNMSHAATKRVFCIAFEAFLDMVQWLLPKIPAGLPFLLFITTLKRGGTCAAHPPPPAGSPGVSNRRSQFSKSIPEKHSQDFRPRIHANLPSPYPFSFPPGPHRPPHDRKNQEEFFLLAFFSIFGPSELHSKFCIEKMQKKVRKSRILASPSPPQTLPKCFQNRGPKKHAIFRRFLLDFFFVLFTLIS